MTALLDRLRTRLMPALLTAAGVALIAAGLLGYSGPAAAVDGPPPSPTQAAASASVGPIPSATSSAGPSGPASPSGPPRSVASRVVVPALGIDLPIVASPPNETFPWCNVAEYQAQYSQPGKPGTTFLYAHARTGMFLPLLKASLTNDGKAMIGDLVQVYTSDDQLFLYQISRVYRHQSSIPFGPVDGGKEGQLMLQTSEGPRKGVTGYTGLVLVVLATPLSDVPADHATANPPAHPAVCG
ncbi:MAG: sortase domain-containing protein [Candidatus Limnocylindrales bacterium]